MPCIDERRGKFRVRLLVNGERVSRTFRTREQAEQWGGQREQLMRLQHEAKRPGSPMKLVPSRVLTALSLMDCTAFDITNGSFPTGATRSGVYFLILRNDIVYVGQSKDWLSRLSRHMRNGARFDAFNVIPCEPEGLDELEERCIAAFMPHRNRQFGVAA